MKKVLYFSLVDWCWIKQRPHHISEGLTRYFDVIYVCKRNIRRSTTVEQLNNHRLKIYRFFCFPLASYISNFVHYLNSLLFKLKFLQKDLNGFEYIIFTHPLQIDWIPKKLLKSATILYDCMDSYKDFDNRDVIKNIINKNEPILVNIAKRIIVSSDEIKCRILENYKNLDKSSIIVINNGVDLQTFSNEYIEQNKEVTDKDLELIKKNTSLKKIGYIGTISNWIDWEVIYEAAHKCDDIMFYFVGPIDKGIPKYIQRQQNIVFTGPKEYYKVPLFIREFDILLYPFKLNDLVLAVNPVKLYEYLALNKKVISVRYNETERFAEYVNLYSTKKEFIKLINEIKNSDDTRDLRKFVLTESWTERSKNFYNVMEKIK